VTSACGGRSRAPAYTEVPIWPSGAALIRRRSVRRSVRMSYGLAVGGRTQPRRLRKHSKRIQGARNAVPHRTRDGVGRHRWEAPQRLSAESRELRQHPLPGGQASVARAQNSSAQTSRGRRRAADSTMPYERIMLGRWRSCSPKQATEQRLRSRKTKRGRRCAPRCRSGAPRRLRGTTFGVRVMAHDRAEISATATTFRQRGRYHPKVHRRAPLLRCAMSES
jgi:hypothetical protein